MTTITIPTDPFASPPEPGATTTAPELNSGAIDTSADRRPSFGRLVRTELRKMTDTRSGRVLLGITVGLGVFVNLIMVILASGDVGDFSLQEGLTFSDYAAGAQIGMVFLLPSIVILAVTSEWTQRAAMTTFTLVPGRGRVLLAKLVAAVAATLAIYVVTLGVGTIANLLAGAVGDGPAPWGSDQWWILGDSLSFVYIALMAFAFAVLALNSASALVGYYIVNFALSPLMFGLSGIGKIGSVLQWVAPDAYEAVMYEPSVGSHWAHAAVSAAIWVVIPMAIGVRRVLTTEIK